MGSDKDKAEKKRLKAKAKIIKARSKAEKKWLEAEKKLIEARSKAEKKRMESQRLQPASTPKAKSSPALRFAEAVRGALYVITSASLILAVVLQEKGVWLQLNDVVEDLMVMRLGQVVLIVIALALFIYGLKHIRLVK
jgi:hypothetical protein